jgi:hypothetical protein
MGELIVFEIQKKIKFIDQKKFSPPLDLGGPWEGLGTETPLPRIHSEAQGMASKHHLMKKKKKKKIEIQVWACNHHHELYNTSAFCEP